MLNLLHSSDWHLGATLGSVSRDDEHRLFLAWLLNTLGAQQVGHDLQANNAAFLLRLLACNTDILVQIEAKKAEAAQRAVVRIGLIARQRRFYNTAGRLLRASNQWLLRVADIRLIQGLFGSYAPDLATSGLWP